jgi:phosphoglycolate phosphatase
MATVLLFDLDGTLINTGGAGRRAMDAAFAKLFGKENAFANFKFDGMTDFAIARAGLKQHHGDDAVIEQAAIDAFLATYFEHLELELPKSDKYVVLPGVAALIESLANLPNVAVGLGTGNIKRGAYAKLVRSRLDGHFAFGGFGCDAEDRIELVRRGAERGAERLGRPLAECRVIVIGDTPKDIAAAKGIGAACLAVATGGYTREDLLAHEPAHVSATLAEENVRELLLSRLP